VDYAAARDFERLLGRGLIAEVDYETARRWRMTGPIDNVMMLAQSPLNRRVLLPMIVVGQPSYMQNSPATPHQ
jgi:hypothetical protein